MIDTKAIRMDIDKPRKPQLLWLTSTLVKALDEVDRRQGNWVELKKKLQHWESEEKDEAASVALGFILKHVMPGIEKGKP